MRALFIRWLLWAIYYDESVRNAIAEIVEETNPAPVHRPISKNTAPGAI